MARRISARSALAGGVLGSLAAGLAVWGGVALPTLVPLAALLGATLGWLLDRRYRAPLRRLAASVDRTTAGLRRQIEQKESEHRRLQEILESMTDGVLVANLEDRVELLNPSFAALFAAREVRPGQNVLELSRSPALVGFLDRLAAQDGAGRERIESEAGRTLELRGRRLADERRVVVARDLTEQLRLDETRRDLVANVSHELRTPLTAIRGYAENLRDGAVGEPATAERFLDRILVQCTRLEALLEDLLALSRLERDKPIPLEPGLDLAALAERSLETVRGLAAERGVELRLRAQAVPPIVGNEESLERLLLNLLENAIKYNREGGNVEVGLTANGDELVLEVADSGIGVPRGDLRRIFERFYRVDAGRSREEGGTGLGLAIVKHAAQLHGGRVEVSSELGRGSVFRVLLPVTRS